MKILISGIILAATLTGNITFAEDLGLYVTFSRKSSDLRIKKYSTFLIGENTADWSYNTTTFQITDDGSRKYLYSEVHYDAIYVNNLKDFCILNKGALESIQIVNKTYATCKILNTQYGKITA